MGKGTLIDGYTKGKFSRQEEETGNLGRVSSNHWIWEEWEAAWEIRGVGKQEWCIIQASAPGLLGEPAKGNIENWASDSNLELPEAKEEERRG